MLYFMCWLLTIFLFQYVTDIGGFYQKGGSPAGGIFDSSCLYAYILEWKVGSLSLFFSECWSKGKRKILTLLCPKSYDSCRQITLLSFIILSFLFSQDVTFLKYISLLIYFFSTFSTPPHLHPRSVKVEEEYMLSSVFMVVIVYVYSREIVVWRHTRLYTVSLL